MHPANKKTGPCDVYVLTNVDANKIWALLSAARDAIGELLDYRRVEPIDECAEFPAENAFYERSSNVLREYDFEKDLPF